MQISFKNAALLLLWLVLALTAFFMANVDLPAWSHIVSGFSVVLFVLPSYRAAFRWLGLRDSILLFVFLGVFALAFETTAIATGFPYGDFSYSGLLGFKLFGTVPWTVSFAWTPLILAAYAAAHKLISSRWPRIASVAALLVVFDLVLDPGAVKVGFWEYSEIGWYYGVPWSNYFGWLISGIVAAVFLEGLIKWFRPILPVPVQLIQSGALTIFFWTCISLFSGLFVPALIGFAVFALLAWFYLTFYYSFDDMVVLVDDSDEPLGTAPKLPIHTMDTPLHRAFSVFLFNKHGELLLQQRAKDKKTWGGVWSNSCCGHVMLHEGLKNAAKRRLRYELGLKGIALNVVLPDFRYRAEKDGVVENEICPVLVGFVDSDPSINEDEVADYRWIDWNRFLDTAKSPESGISPWAVEEAILLENNPEFRELYNAFSRA
jgi:isopentenyl-diphosphate delta-isomerase type 1